MNDGTVWTDIQDDIESSSAGNVLEQGTCVMVHVDNITLYCKKTSILRLCIEIKA